MQNVATKGLEASAKGAVDVFNKSIFNKTSAALAVGVFFAELCHLGYQRLVTKKINSDEFWRKARASAASNAAGFVGASLGHALGFFLGNLICPGAGGYFGGIAVGFLT